MKGMDAVEHDMPRSGVAWVNLIASRCRWSFWETLLDVKVGDPILHLRGKGNSAAFVGFSVAAADGFATEDRPPAPGEWGYADTFY